jgi:hypothetical protein
MIQSLDLYAKGIAALWGAGLIWIADVSASTSLPGWIGELGLPVAFLLAVVYALVSVHKALRESEKGRRDDWKEFSDNLREMVEHGQKSREELIKATNDQTHVLQNLAAEIKSRPCQK